MSADDPRRSPRRDRLVDAGVDLFRRHGPGATGVAAVCAAAGTTKGVFSHHFPSGKDELVTAVVRRNAAQVDSLVAAALTRATSPGAAVARCFGAYARLLEDDPDVGCPVAAAVVDRHAVSPGVRSAAAGAFDGWQDRVAAALVDRGVPPPAAAALATTVVAGMEGAILLALARREPEVLHTTGAVLAEAVDGAVAAARG